MRPDKKKTRHHDSQKAKNRALAANANDNKDNKSKSQKSERPVASVASPTHFREKKEMSATVSESLESGNTSKINLEAEGRSAPDEEEDADFKSKSYSKRKIESNWANYELPPSDDEQSEEEEATMTGLDFNYVIENARGADSLFRLKAEKEWEEKQTMFTNEMFSLDLSNLEKAISCVPLHEQLSISESEFERMYCPKAYSDLTERAKRNAEKLVEEIKDGPQEDIEVVNQRLLSMILSNKSQSDEASGLTGNTTANFSNAKERVELKSEVDSEDRQGAAGVVQKTLTWKSNTAQEEVIDDDELENLLKMNTTKTPSVIFPTISKASDNTHETKPENSTVKSSANKSIVSELELEFNEESTLTSIKSHKNATELANPSSRDKSNIDTNEKSDLSYNKDTAVTQNLEDWLDDFLSD